jgi:hypothetical protein
VPDAGFETRWTRSEKQQALALDPTSRIFAANPNRRRMPMNSFFSSLGASISAGIKALGAEIQKFAAFMKPLLVASAEEIGTAALAQVLVQAPLVISGQEKMTAAVANVKTTLAASGKTAGLSLIQAAVQDAHDQLSAALAAGAAN